MLSARAVNIAVRTAHIAAMGILLGGHAFGIEKADLLPSLWWAVGTGLALATVEAGPQFLWFHQGRGLMTITKLLLIAAVPLFWQHRLAILLAVVALGSIGSHMSARYRYYSIIYKQVIRCGDGPGTAGLDDDTGNHPAGDNNQRVE